MQRRIEQADGDGKASHNLEDRLKICALFGQQLGQRGAATGLILGQDHLAHGGNPARIEEHMLGAAQPDTLCAKLPRHPAIGRGFSVGADFHPAVLIGPVHQYAEIADKFGLDGRNFARHDCTGRAVEGDDIAFLQRAAADPQGAARHIDRDAGSA